MKLKPSRGWRRIKSRQVTERVLLISAEMLKFEDCEVSTNNILNQPHDSDDGLLLETILCNMRASTLCYGEKNTERKDKNN